MPGPCRRWWLLVVALSSGSALLACSHTDMLARFVSRNISGLFREPRPVKHRLSDARVPSAALVATWVGHSTVLLQLGDKYVLTDPVFTDSVGQISRRLVEPGLLPEALPPLDAVVVSHMHFDHLSLGSLDLIESKMRVLVLPKGGAVYAPRSRPLPTELATWQSVELDGLRITAVPVGHVGWRYLGDWDWMKTSYTGYVIEYAGHSVYFGGDTSYVPEAFRAARSRLGPFDLALLPIAPLNPRELMCQVHVDPAEALDAFELLGANYMLPIHYDTFVKSFDEVGDAPRELAQLTRERGLGKKVVPLEHGARHVFAWKR